MHFKELKDRLYFCIFFFVINFLISFYYSDVLYDIFSYPMKIQGNYNLVSNKVTTTFIVPLKIAFNFTIILFIPYLSYNIWLFISPGLYNSEKKDIKTIFIFSISLFFFGIMFSFFFICPLTINFFIGYAPDNIDILFTIDNYLSFTTSIMIASGLAFQIPLITYALTYIGILEKNDLSKNRRYIIVFSFLISMLLTPPDVISQLLLAFPIILLFEIGLLISKDRV